MELTAADLDKLDIQVQDMEELAGIPGAADAEALLGQLDGVLEVMGIRIHLVELEDMTWVALQEEDVAPCYRKGEVLRWTTTHMYADTQMVAAYSNGELVAVLKTIFVPDMARKALRLAAMKLV